MFGLVVMVVFIGNVVFVWYLVVDVKVLYFLVYINYFVYVFVVNNYRYRNGFLSLVVLVVNVYVGIVYSGFVNFD